MAPPPQRPLDEAFSGRPGADTDLRAWIVQYGPALRRYFLKKVSAAEAEDLVQDVFLSLQARGAATAIDNVESYLFRTAANVLVRRHRRRTWDWDRHDPLDAIELRSDEPSPERVLIGKQAMDAVSAVLLDLPPRTAEAFFLNRFEAMTYEAVARRMGVSVKAVEQLIQRALRRLAERLEAGS